MKKLLTLLAIVLTLSAVPGCASWWSRFKEDPVAQVHAFEQTVQVAVTGAQLAWSVILPSLPTTTQAAANQQFTNAIAAVNHALQVLNDGVEVAVETQQSHPDFGKLLAAVSDAVSQVIAIVDQYKAPAPTATGDAGALSASKAAAAPPGYDDSKAAATLLKKMSARP